MRNLIITLVLILLPACLLAQICGKVISITDGDTFTMLLGDNTKIKVRLHGIDCPEKSQDFGQVAKQYAADKIFGEQVCIDDKGKDRYGRTIGTVHYGNRILNEDLLSAGLAWHYLKYDQSIRYSNLEGAAKKSKAGLWSQSNPIAPWDFRHK
jgi:micrococcal nuclease